MINRVLGGRVPSAFVLLCVVLLAWEIHALFLKAHGVPSTASAGRWRTISASHGVTVSQTMKIDAPGFRSIAVRLDTTQPRDAALLGFELSEVRDSKIVRPIYRWTGRGDEVGSNAWYTLEFPPLEDSAGRTYRLDIRKLASQGSDLKLVATGSGEYLEGMLFVADREQWGDLIFETAATGATAFRRVEALLRDKPWIVRSRLMLGGVFLVYNWALLTFLYELAFRKDVAADENKLASSRGAVGRLETSV